MSSCLTPTVTKRYPSAPSNTSAPCKMYDEYVPCDDCPDYPNGYPAEKCLVINVNGKCWMAISMEDNNTSNPYNFIGKTDESGAWIVMEPCDMLKWFIKNGTGDFLTEDQINALVSNFLTEDQINALVSNFLTEEEIKALIEPLESFIDALGCVMSVKNAEPGMTVKSGEWVCNDGCWRQAKKDLVLGSSVSIPAVESDNWGPCKSISDLLALVNLDLAALTSIMGVKQACTNDALTADMRLVTGDQIGAGLWWNPDTCKLDSISASIPTGCQEFVATVAGTFTTDIATATPYSSTDDNNYYDAHPRGSLTYTVDEFPYLGVPGRNLCVSFNSAMGYALLDPQDNTDVGSRIQTGFEISINGVVTRWIDGFFMNGDGNDYQSGTTNCHCFETTGEDIVVETTRWVRTDTNQADGTPYDYTGVVLSVDVSEITGQFSAGSSVTTSTP